MRIEESFNTKHNNMVFRRILYNMLFIKNPNCAVNYHNELSVITVRQYIYNVKTAGMYE